MTQQAQYTDQIRDKTEYLAPTEWRQATNVVNTFLTDEDFIKRVETRWLDPTDITTVGYADTLSFYAEDYCAVNQLEGLLDQSQADQIKLISNAPLFLHNLNEIAYCEKLRKNHRFSQAEGNYYQGLKLYAVWYNQLLANYAYSNPGGTMSGLNAALVQQSATIFPGNEDVITCAVVMATRGARTEAVARHLFDLAGIEYTPGTLEEDLQGGDFIVMYKGHHVKVDIKSSLHQIVQLRGGYAQINRECIDYAIKELDCNQGRKKQFVIVLYGGFTDVDLGDSLGMQLPQEAVQQHAESLARQLRRALEELWG